MKTRKFGLVIGLLLIAVIAVGGLWLLKNPVGYISIDVNPSIEMSYNRLNKVVAIQGVNQDGRSILNGHKLVGQDVDDAIEEIVEALLSKGYLTQEGSRILFSADDSSSSQELLTRIKYEVVYWLKEYYENTDVVSQTFDLDKDERALADKYGISYGKFAILKELIDDADDIESLLASGFMDMNIGELLDYLRDNDIELDDLDIDWDDDDDDMDDDDDDDMDDDDDDMDDDDDDDDMDDDDDDLDDDDDDDMDDDNDDDMDDDDDDDDMDDNDNDDMDDDDNDDLDDDNDDDWDDDNDDDWDDGDDDDWDDDNDDDDWDDGDDDDWDDDNDDDDGDDD